MPLPCSSVKWNREEMGNNCFPQLRCNCWFYLFMRAPPGCCPKAWASSFFILSLCIQPEVSPIQFVSTAALCPPGTECTSLLVLCSPAPGQALLCQPLLAHPVLLLVKVSLVLLLHLRGQHLVLLLLLPAVGSQQVTAPWRGLPPTFSFGKKSGTVLKTDLPSPHVKKQSSLMALINFSVKDPRISHLQSRVQSRQNCSALLKKENKNTLFQQPAMSATSIS